MKDSFNRKGRAEKFRAESILAQKRTRLRLALVSRMNDPLASFDLSEYKTFVENVRSMLDDPRAFDVEARNAHIAMDRLEAPRMPDLSTPEKQLLWAATLFYVHRTATRETYYGGEEHSVKVNLKITALWKQILESPDAAQVLCDQGVYICEELRHPHMRFAWGDPDTGIRYDSFKKAASVDFLYALTIGLEHTGSLMLREIGRNRLSRTLPGRNAELRETILRLKEKEKAEKALAGDDYKTLRKAALEWQMREMLWRAAEKSATNRYTERKGRETAQDHAYSLNYIQMAGTHFGSEALRSLRGDRADSEEDAYVEALGALRESMEEKRRELLRGKTAQGRDGLLEEIERNIKLIDKELRKAVAPEARFINLVNAIELSFFKNNGLFENTQEGWRRFGIKPDLIGITKEGFSAGLPPSSGGKREGTALSSDFSYLLELCGGPKGLENTQPGADARWQGKAYFNALARGHSAQRNAIIETIWDLYAQDIFEELAQALEKQIDKQLGNEQKQPQQGQEDQQDQAQQQEGAEGQGKQGSGQKQDSRPGGKPGKGGGQGAPQSRSESQDFGAGGEAFGDQRGAGGGESQDLKPKDFDPMKAGTNYRNIDVKNDKEQTRKMDDVNAPAERPDGQSADADENGRSMEQAGEGQEGKGAAGKTLDEIRQELEKAMKDAAEKAAQSQQKGDGGKSGKESKPGDGQSAGEKGEGGGKDGKPSPQGMDDKSTDQKTLEDIANGNWPSYANLKAELAGYINRTGKLLQRIRDQQVEKTVCRSEELEPLPEGMDLTRLNDEAQRNLTVKKKAGKQEKDDLNRFHKDKTDHKPAKIDIVLLIDGSGSMTMEGYKLGKTKPMDIALLSSIILYEAAKEVDANVYIALWGNNDPIMLAKPGDDIHAIEKNLLNARNGLNCGTNLAPSIRKITKVLAEQKQSGYSGYTHMMVISDGDISDEGESINVINTLLSTNPYATLEFAILKKDGERQSDMEKVAEKVRSANPAQKIGVHRDGNPNSIPAGIVGLIFQKIRTLGSFIAVPWSKKRKLFQQALNGFGIK